jgi:hypothetical protein
VQLSHRDCELGGLPGDIVSYVRTGLHAYDQGIPFRLDNRQASKAWPESR